MQIGADFITSKAYINDCREIISSAAKASATIDAKANASTTGESVASNKDAFAEMIMIIVENGKKKNSKGKGGKRGRRNNNDSDDEDAQEVKDVPSKSSKRRGKGKRSKKGKRGDDDDEYEAQFSNARKKGGGPDSKKGGSGGQQKTWKASDINKILQEHDKSLENEDEENLLEALGVYLLEFGRKEYKKSYDVAIEQLSKSGAANTRDILNALEKQFHAQYASLQNNAKTCADYRKLVDDVLLQMAEDDDSKDGEGEGEGAQDSASTDFAKRSKDVALHLSGLKKMCIESCSKQILAIIVGMELSKVGVDVLEGQDCASQSPGIRHGI